MAAETIKSVVEGELQRFTGLDQGKLARAGVWRDVMVALNMPTNRGLVHLPGEGELGSQDWERRVAGERVAEVRALVGGIVRKIADKENVITNIA